MLHEPRAAAESGASHYQEGRLILEFASLLAFLGVMNLRLLFDAVTNVGLLSYVRGPGIFRL